MGSLAEAFIWLSLYMYTIFKHTYIFFMWIFNELDWLFIRIKQLFMCIYVHQIKIFFIYIFNLFKEMHHYWFYILNKKTVYEDWIENNTTHMYGIKDKKDPTKRWIKICDSSNVSSWHRVEHIIVKQTQRGEKMNEFIETDFDEN